MSYAKALHYIEYFTDLKIELGSERVFAMLYGSGLMHGIYQVISSKQRDDIEDAIRNAIRHKLNIVEAGQEAKIADAADKIDKAAQAFEELTKLFSGIGDNAQADDISMLHSFKASVDSAVKKQLNDGVPVARYDVKKRRVYVEYPDGTIKYR